MLKNVYCIFDSMCLGLECCINFKFVLFVKVFKIWVCFDFCVILYMLFFIGFDLYIYIVEIFVNIIFDGNNVIFKI